MFVFLGGRTNPLVDLVQTPLHSYHFAHRWIGAVAVAEALCHSGLVLRRRGAFDALQTSGITAAVSLLLILIAYPWFFWRPWRYFGKLHMILYLGVMAGWTWHILIQRPSTARVFALVSCGLWCSTHLYRLAWVFLFDRSHAVVEVCCQKGEVTFLKLKATKPMRVFPGCYFYIFFRGPLPLYNLIHGYPMMLIWSESNQFAKGRVKELSFLIAQKGHHDQAVACTQKGASVRLEGPYGEDLRLHNYENVVLTAKGLGIAGILPFALHLAGRKQHDDVARDEFARRKNSNNPVFRDLTRNVDVFWWLEHNDQEDWVKDQLRELQDLHEVNSESLVVWCIYPSLRTNEDNDPLFKPDGYFFVKYDVDLAHFSRELRQEARYPGRAIVLACGDDAFMTTMRDTVLENSTAEKDISLAELVYRPHFGERPGKAFSLSPVSGETHVTGDIEMQDTIGDARPPSRLPLVIKPPSAQRATRRVSRLPPDASLPGSYI
ncbi:hypothetical protein B0H63DRAFT_477588 [Podospora didyma]|uniref:Ferric oxidoreductase domain-containing protein n=1 Tax=Podospora didyma TaxID=330526 RepID=A0AAE0NB94_9PEZI|nr:hypothetical protein B0H63DRAFT_477588 [Podospora didyma]